VEEADKLAVRALSEWAAGDEKKAVKYADKASRKAERSHGSALETERALANIMAGLREVKPRRHTGVLLASFLLFFFKKKGFSTPEPVTIVSLRLDPYTLTLTLPPHLPHYRDGLRCTAPSRTSRPAR
jgi:hypothetical protein